MYNEPSISRSPIPQQLASSPNIFHPFVYVCMYNSSSNIFDSVIFFHPRISSSTWHHADRLSNEQREIEIPRYTIFIINGRTEPCLTLWCTGSQPSPQRLKAGSEEATGACITGWVTEGEKSIRDGGTKNSIPIGTPFGYCEWNTSIWRRTLPTPHHH